MLLVPMRQNRWCQQVSVGKCWRKSSAFDAFDATGYQLGHNNTLPHNSYPTIDVPSLESVISNIQTSKCGI